jgi:hypothetical protein
VEERSARGKLRTIPYTANCPGASIYGGEKMTDKLQQLIDKDAIRDAMLRYARGVDRRDWEAVRDTFFEDGTDHHADFRGVRDTFIDWVKSMHASVPKSTHFLGNCLIEFGSDTVAAVETYFIAILELSAESEGHRKRLLGDSDPGEIQGTIRVDVLGRYVDRFEKRNGEWKVAKRQVAFDATHARPNIGSVDANLEWVLGKRDGSDVVFEVRRDAGVA